MHLVYDVYTYINVFILLVLQDTGKERFQLIQADLNGKMELMNYWILGKFTGFQLTLTVELDY